jgi:hypothetical protein
LKRREKTNSLRRPSRPPHLALSDRIEAHSIARHRAQRLAYLSGCISVAENIPGRKYLAELSELLVETIQTLD